MNVNMDYDYRVGMKSQNRPNRGGVEWNIRRNLNI